MYSLFNVIVFAMFLVIVLHHIHVYRYNAFTFSPCVLQVHCSQQGPNTVINASSLVQAFHFCLIINHSNIVISLNVCLVLSVKKSIYIDIIIFFNLICSLVWIWYCKCDATILLTHFVTDILLVLTTHKYIQEVRVVQLGDYMSSLELSLCIEYVYNIN